MMLEPIPGSVWKHTRKGTTYVVNCVARMQSDDTPVVVYRQIGQIEDANERTPIWVRPLGAFLTKFEEIGS